MKITINSSSIRNALRLYISHLVFITIAFLNCKLLPYYQHFLSDETQTTFVIIYILYLVTAPIYYLLAFSIGWLNEEDIAVSKSTLMLQYLGRFLKVIWNLCQGKVSDIFTSLRMDFPAQNAFMSTVVKYFFIPIMTNFFFVHVRATTDLFRNIPQDTSMLVFTFGWLYWAIYHGLFIVDVGIFLIAYSAEAKWLGNKIKSVEPTAIGWCVALACYPPFQGISGSLLPSGAETTLVITSIPILLTMKIFTLIFFAIYVWASISLFLRAGNLVNRGIVSKGAYRYIRHPAYISKCLAWWMERLPFILFDYRAIFFLFCWNIVYFYRAITEERHLLRDPDYMEYATKVRYRFIPGVF